MKTRTPLLIIYLAVSGLASSTAYAEVKPAENQAVSTDTQADTPVETEVSPSTEAPAAEGAALSVQPATDEDVTEKPAAEDLSTEEGKSLTEEGELLVPEEIVSRRILNEMEIGIGYVSDDAYKFGRYNGMQEKGPFVIGDLRGRSCCRCRRCPRR